MFYKTLIISFSFLFPLYLSSQTVFSFDSIFNKKPILKTVSQDYKKYKLQIIYTQVIRDKANKPVFKNYTFKVDSSNYFYCASLVKLPCSILALEKINSLSDKKIDKNTIMFTDSLGSCQRAVKKDTTSINGYPSLAQYIKKMLLVSDNSAYGRVYEFLGVDEIHNRLSELGYKNMRIVHRFDGNCLGTEHTTTNPISFYDTNMNLLYHQNQQQSTKTYTSPIGTIHIGKAYMNKQNKKIHAPKDFTNMNYISLENIHSILQRLVFYDDAEKSNRYNITKDDQLFLMKYLSMYPRESAHPTYPTKTYFDSYKKYFIYGDSKKPITDTNIKITNIVGQSFGFMVDCAYITNASKHIEFILSAVIYTNENEVINDGKYEYQTIALPFLAELGRQIYKFELENNKKLNSVNK